MSLHPLQGKINESRTILHSFCCHIWLLFFMVQLSYTCSSLHTTLSELNIYLSIFYQKYVFLRSTFSFEYSSDYLSENCIICVFIQSPNTMFHFTIKHLKINIVQQIIKLLSKNLHNKTIRFTRQYIEHGECIETWKE